MMVVVAVAAVAGACLVVLGARAARPVEAPAAPAPVCIVVVLPPALALPPVTATSSIASAASASEAQTPVEEVRPAVVLPRTEARPDAREAPPVTTRPKRVGASGQPARRLSAEMVAWLHAPTGSHSQSTRRLLERAGRLLERGARWDAMALYARVLKAHPAEDDALMGVALCRFELGDRAKARRLVDQLLARRPSHAPAAILRGFLEQLAGRAAAAVAWYQRALAQLDGDPALSGELQQVVMSLGADATEPLAEAP